MKCFQQFENPVQSPKRFTGNDL